MPGGVKNKNAGKILGIIFVVCLVLAIISVVAAIPMVMKYVPQLKNAYTVPGE
jgi:flagellar basal body-associated protein FliL